MVTRVCRGPLVLVAVLLLAALGVGGALGARWWYRPGPGPSRVVIIAPRTSVAAVAATLAAAGVLDSPLLFEWNARVRGVAGRLRAGEYALAAGMAPGDVAALLVSGRVLLHPVTLVEGRTVAEVLATLKATEFLHATVDAADGPPLRRLAGPDHPSLEGLLFPDTYRVPRGASDLDVMTMARARMTAELAAVWARRDEGLPLTSPYEALVLASLIEKETANPTERPHIAAVFLNRLRRGMRLQTDPTVIYGLGARYTGALHRADLTGDTPWNTYTRDGLPPTPIALPGLASLDAAVHPTPSADLYFVASGLGDGRHTFSATLKAHNAAVAAYRARQRHGEAIR